MMLNFGEIILIAVLDWWLTSGPVAGNVLAGSLPKNAEDTKTISKVDRKEFLYRKGEITV
jgi:hypothetical protein